MKLVLTISFLSMFLFFSCSTTKQATKENKDSIVATINAHGGKYYELAAYAFEFRKKTYTFKNDGGKYVYSVKSKKEGKEIFDVLSNDGFTRSINGVKQTLTEKQNVSYGNTLNSVLYFALLPYKLDDPAVEKTSKGTITIKGKAYSVVEVRFSKEGGGKDHDDVFYYWINQKNNLIDYLAYEFHVNKGGIRFRSAYNSRKVAGIHFQDYVNYKVELGTSMMDLPKLFEAGKLKELSRIELENIRVL